MRTAFVFPGQGSQHVGMAVHLYRASADFRAVVDEAAAISGLPLLDVMAAGPATRLASPDIAQLAVVCMSLGLLRMFRAAGVMPDAALGHSAGEYAALVAAGVIDEETALRMVVERGRAMVDGAPAGAMVAITGLDVARVERLCEDAASIGVVVVAAHNSAVQVVVSGAPIAVDGVAAAARGRGALRVDRLATGGAFHSPLMGHAEAAMAERIRLVTLRPPAIPLFSSVTGGPLRDVESYRTALSRQITARVRWAECAASAAASGVRRFVEIGPGRTLSALLRRVDRSVQVHTVHDVPSWRHFLAAIAPDPNAGTAAAQR